MSKELQLLIQRIQPPAVEYSMAPPTPSPELIKLMTRIENRHWKEWELQRILAILEEWYLELKLIEHTRECERCQKELELAVSRYGGRNGPWYLDLQYETGWGSEVYEEDPLYKDCPRLYDYEFQDYWVAANMSSEKERQDYLRRTSADTIRFILDRMKWGESKIRPLTEALVDYYIEVENWDLDSPISAEPTLQNLHFFGGDMMGRPINGKVLLQQLTALNPLWRVEYGIENAVQMKEDTVRLCSRRKHKINIDITLSALDLYDFKAYLLRNHGLELALIFNEQGYYCDQLDMVMKTIMKKAEEAKPSDFKPMEAFI